MHKNLTCPNCNTNILSDDIILDKALAKCRNCHLVLDLEEEMNKGKAQRKEEIFVIPKGIEILKLFGELNIEIEWRHSTSYFMMFFTVVWNMMILPFAIFAILSGELFILLFISLHLAVGIGLIFWALSALFNTTYITVDEYFLKVEHRPFKLFYKEYNLELHQIKQLYVKKYQNGSTNGNPNYAYAVMIQMDNHGEYKLVKGIAKPPQALFIEQEIEKFLNIPDRPVVGEL